jgi:hypothetical protein
MKPEESTIRCPACGAEINVSDVLFHQVLEQLKKNFDAQSAAKEKEFKQKELKLQQEKELLEKTQESLQEQINAAVKQKVSAEKANMEKTLWKQIDEEKSEQVKKLEEELNKKSEQVKALHGLEGELSKVKREKDELRAAIEAESETKLNELLTKEREKITSAEAEKAKLDLMKRDKLIEDLTKRLDEAQKKLELGFTSNKIVGEVTETQLRDLLRAEFPFDLVDDVPSGIRGVDVIMTVRNNFGTACGIIGFERKMTMNFSEGWIGKLREDGRKIQANALVLVTQSFPRDNPVSHLRNDVWVVSFDDLKIIVTLLRVGIIKAANAMTSQQNKGTKMEALYDYLVSPEFANSVTALLENFRKTEKLISKEKEAALRTFAEREAHLWSSKRALIELYGKISAIAADGMSQLTEQVNMLEETTKGSEG